MRCLYHEMRKFMEEKRADGRERDAHVIFRDPGGEVFKDSRGVNGGALADAKIVPSVPFEASVLWLTENLSLNHDDDRAIPAISSYSGGYEKVK